MEIDLKEFVAGGYCLAKYNERAEYTADFLPPKIISASECIVDIFPSVWSADSIEKPNQAKREARSYSVSVDNLPQVLEWAEKHREIEIGWGNTFFSINKAREFANLFYDFVSELNVIGIGLKRELVVDYLNEEDAGYGVYEHLKQEKSLERGGEILGFEVLGNDYGSFHSWLCNGLEKDCKGKFGVIPNQNGFIATFEEAEKCAEYANRDEVGAEPCLWLPWLILNYKI